MLSQPDPRLSGGKTKIYAKLPAAYPWGREWLKVYMESSDNNGVGTVVGSSNYVVKQLKTQLIPKDLCASIRNTTSKEKRDRLVQAKQLKRDIPACDAELIFPCMVTLKLEKGGQIIYPANNSGEINQALLRQQQILQEGR